MQAFDGLLSIYITGEYTKEHLDSIKEALPDVRITKYNRKLNDENAIVKHITDCIPDADMVIAIYSSSGRDGFNNFDFDVGYAKALNRRILVLGTNENFECGSVAEAAADYNPKLWKDALSILITLTDLATTTP